MNKNLDALSKSLYQLSFKKQAEDIKNLTKEQAGFLIPSKESEIKEWQKVLESVSSASESYGFAPTLDSLSQAALRKLKSVVNTEGPKLAAASKKDFEEMKKHAHLITKQAGYLDKITELGKDYQKGLSQMGGWGKGFLYLGRAFSAYGIVHGIYVACTSYFSGVEKKLKPEFGLTATDTVLNPSKITAAIQRNSKNPQSILTLVEITKNAQDWVLAIVEILGGIIDIITDIVGVALSAAAVPTGGTSLLGAGAINFVTSMINLFVQIYAAPRWTQDHYGPTFFAAKEVASSNIKRLEKEIKDLRKQSGEKSLEDLFKEFEALE
jgi:hypothetical protein